MVLFLDDEMAGCTHIHNLGGVMESEARIWITRWGILLTALLNKQEINGKEWIHYDMYHVWYDVDEFLS